ncbi:DUF1254 domain-containing protein [uncultured Thalassolituus sp.]|uniref:DUF1254 domain-containing protein n=2 Tax=Thalassolituus TaxID=187492 RepID=UPI0026208BA0|nr:DUF1254 domain-containing protein [uncultured Thalassolituus sp.]
MERLLSLRSLQRPLSGIAMGCLLLLVLPVTVKASSLATSAAMGYVYGFPIVLMGETLDGMTGPERSCSLGADINTFKHVYEIPDERFKAVVRPNVDTLYSSAMLDLSSGPVLLDMPAVSDRYILMALVDAWSNNFAGVGTQSHGAEEGHYFITGPGWRGRVPRGYQRIDSPTDLVWIIGRTEILEGEDLSAVHAIQDQFTLSTRRASPPPFAEINCKGDNERTPPIEVVKDLSGDEFFQRLSQLMQDNPPPAEDRWMVSQLQAAGLIADARGQEPRRNRLENTQLDIGTAMAQASLDGAISMLGLKGWGPDPDAVPLGDYGRRYFIRAVVAQVGFGANKNEYATYQNTMRDANRMRLNGQNTYTFTMNADDLPPVDAFWSMTVYQDNGFLAVNEMAAGLGIERYAVGTNTGLVEDDGKVTVILSHLPPQGIPLSNWLPVPAGDFQLTLRFYDPRDEILKNEWEIPELIRE